MVDELNKDEETGEGMANGEGGAGAAAGVADAGANGGEAGKDDGAAGKDAGVVKEKDLETLKGEHETLTKRLSDKDSHIVTLERENATLRKGHKQSSSNKDDAPTDLTSRYPKEAEQISRLRLEGRDLEADELSAQVRVKVYEERIAVEKSARTELIDDSQSKSNLRDFDKYREIVEKGLKDIPLNVLKSAPDYWIAKEYNAAVGADYLSLKGKKKTGAIDGGGGQAAGEGGSDKGQGGKTEGELVSDSIAAAYPKSGF